MEFVDCKLKLLLQKYRNNILNYSYLRKIWLKCLANDAKSNDKDIIKPPTTAVRRILFLRHNATKKGVSRCETAKFVEPIQTEIYNK